MRKFLLGFLLILLAQMSFAQTSIKGTLKDTLDVKSVPFASVSLIKQSDSTLVSFTRSDVTGTFTIKNVPIGNYFLLIVQAQYLDYLDKIEVKSNQPTISVGNIALTQVGRLLSEVVITAQNAIVMHGDTLEYAADSFKVRQGAVVEDLLKVLPGIQVDKDGAITAMGQKVQKVLVNGEEFFGSDPTVATQNIQANVVDKVQVFDKKSDQAAFTGFDDGQEQKTINLKLKENMNKGFFGKAELGAGWEDRWNNQAMINWFEGKRQISAYGFMNSNGRTGLSWQDNQQFGSGGGNMRMFGGDNEETQVISSFFEDNDDDLSTGGFGQDRIKPGINKSWTGGARYTNKLDDDKHQISANYSNGTLNRELAKTDFTETILPGYSVLRVDSSTSFNSQNSQNLSARYEWKVDSSLSLIYNLSGQMKNKTSQSDLYTQNETDAEVPISTNRRNNESNSITTRVSNSITANKKLAKEGRTISFFGSHTYNKKTGEGFLLSKNELGLNGLNKTTNYDQRKLDNSLANSFIGTVTYTEPIVKNMLMKLAYGISNDKAGLSTITQDTVGHGLGNYLNQVDSLSNQFDMNILKNSGLVEFMYNKKKINLSIGTAVAYAQFRQDDLIRSRNYDYNRVNFFPSLRFKYKFSQFKRLDVNYSGSTTNPTAQQSQPIQDNTNPLEVYIGNPNLKIGYTQNVRVNFFTFQALSGKGMWAGAFVQNALNPVGLNRTFDLSGRTVNEYVNVGGNFVASAWLGGTMRIGSKGWETRMNTSGSYSNMPSIINSIESRTKNYNVNITPTLSYNNEDKMFFSIDPGFAYNYSANNLSASTRKIKYWSFTPEMSLAFYLPKSFEIGTDVNYEFRPAVSPYPDNFSRFLWDAYASKKVLSKKNLELRFQMWDILNQNKGYSRTTSNNYNTESFYNTLGRYWMVSAVWNFFSGPLAEAQAGSTKSNYGYRRRKH